jgi:hypothetical protein
MACPSARSKKKLVPLICAYDRRGCQRLQLQYRQWKRVPLLLWLWSSSVLSSRSVAPFLLRHSLLLLGWNIAFGIDCVCFCFGFGFLCSASISQVAAPLAAPLSTGQGWYQRHGGSRWAGCGGAKHRAGGSGAPRRVAALTPSRRDQAGRLKRTSDATSPWGLLTENVWLYRNLRLRL